MFIFLFLSKIFLWIWPGEKGCSWWLMRQQTEVGIRRVISRFLLRTLLTPKSQHSMNSLALSCCLIYLANTTIGIPCNLSCHVKICWITLSLTVSPDILLVLHREGYNCSQTKKQHRSLVQVLPADILCCCMAENDHPTNFHHWCLFRPTWSKFDNK